SLLVGSFFSILRLGRSAIYILSLHDALPIWANGDAGLRAGACAGDRVGGDDGLAAGRLEDNPGEGMLAGVRGREGIVGRQDGLGIATREMDRTGVAGGGIAIGVISRDRNRPGRPRRGRRRAAG